MTRFKLIRTNNFEELDKAVDDFINETTKGPRPILVHEVEDVKVTVNSAVLGTNINRIYIATIKYTDNRD